MKKYISIIIISIITICGMVLSSSIDSISQLEVINAEAESVDDVLQEDNSKRKYCYYECGKEDSFPVTLCDPVALTCEIDNPNCPDCSMEPWDAP